MFQIRIHGRGGQGVVSGAEMLSVAAFLEGRYAQAFPSFGSERMGAPVMAFCRIDDKEIRLREPVLEPDALIVQDPTLLHQVDLFSGLQARGLHPDQLHAQLRRAWARELRARRGAVSPVLAPGYRARTQARGPLAAQRGAARRICRGHRADRAGVGCRRDPPEVSRRRRRKNVAAATEAFEFAAKMKDTIDA